MVDAYAAGLFDGEGTVTLCRDGRFRAPLVSVASTTLELLLSLRQNYGGVIVTEHIFKAAHSPSWAWKADRNVALRFLAKIISYLLEPKKRRRVVFLSETYASVTVRNGQYTLEQELKKAEFEEQFFAL